MIPSSLQTFGWLLWRDMRVLKIDFLNNVIDSLVGPAVFIIISGYILPYIGIPLSYGGFMMVSSMVFMAYATTNWRGASQLVADMEGPKSISYELTLPLSSTMVFVKFACTYALNAMFINIFTLPLGKLLLWDRLDLSHFSVPKFLLIYVTATLFFGFYSTWLASWVDGMKGFSRFWLRYGSQLLFFSGYQFTWATLHQAIPVFSYINLLNPFVYTFEGVRGAVLGPEIPAQGTSLPFWVCFVVLWVYIGFFAYLAIRNFREQLDCL
jgi:hypothetical protein